MAALRCQEDTQRTQSFRLFSSVWERRVTRGLRGYCIVRTRLHSPTRAERGASVGRRRGGRGRCGGPGVARGKRSLVRFPSDPAGSLFPRRIAIFWSHSSLPTRQQRGLRRAGKHVFQIPLPSQLNGVGWGRQRREILLNGSGSPVINAQWYASPSITCQLLTQKASPRLYSIPHVLWQVSLYCKLSFIKAIKFPWISSWCWEQIVHILKHPKTLKKNSGQHMLKVVK